MTGTDAKVYWSTENWPPIIHFGSPAGAQYYVASRDEPEPQPKEPLP